MHTFEDTEPIYRDWLIRYSEAHPERPAKPADMLRAAINFAFNAGLGHVDPEEIEAASQRALKLLREYGVTAP